jgi:hypothetical protein
MVARNMLAGFDSFRTKVRWTNKNSYPIERVDQRVSLGRGLTNLHIR